MLIQILDTTELCRELIANSIEMDPEQIDGGPQQVVKEITETMNNYMFEKKLRVKLSQDPPSTEDLSYLWRIYRSVIFHIMLWSVNL